MDVQQKSLSLFQPPPIEKSIRKLEWIEFRPVGQISTGSTIEFNINSTGSDYINLRKSRLQLRCKIVKLDGTDVTQVSNVVVTTAPVNLTLSALWRQVDILLQNKIISPDIGTAYPYKALLDVLSSNKDDVQLQSEYFYKDTSGKMDAAVEGGIRGEQEEKYRTSENVGLMERFEMMNPDESFTFSLEGPIRVDFCEQERDLLNGVPITVRLYPSPDSFRLMDGNGDEAKYKIVVTDAVLNICFVKLNPEVILGHDAALSVGPALYPINQSRIVTHNLAKGSFMYTADGLFNGEIPNNMIVGFVSSEAFAGSYAKNYANFQHYDLNYLEFSVDGASTPVSPFTPNYSNKHYTKEFLSLFNNYYPQTYSNNLIEREEYPDGYCIYSFNIGQTEDGVTSAKRTGHTRLTVKFEKPLKESVTLIIYAKFPKVVQIDKSRAVILP